MIVCVCHAVSDRAIRAVIADGAQTVRDVARRCSAGTDCGACRCTIREMLGAAQRTTRTGSVADTAA